MKEKESSVGTISEKNLFILYSTVLYRYIKNDDHERTNHEIPFNIKDMLFTVRSVQREYRDRFRCPRNVRFKGAMSSQPAAHMHRTTGHRTCVVAVVGISARVVHVVPVPVPVPVLVPVVLLAPLVCDSRRFQSNFAFRRQHVISIYNMKQ
jgi:hypothetical protein